MAEEVLIPALRSAEQFDLMAGFFSGSVLREMAPGLANFITRSDRPMRLLVSPHLSEDDEEALRNGLDMTVAARRVLEEALGDEAALASRLASHARECLAYLLGAGRLHMKVVFTTAGLFHPKQWTFVAGGDTAILSGSANATRQAIQGNVEQLRLDRSWKGGDAQEACIEGRAQFEQYWNDRKQHSRTVGIATAILQELLAPYRRDTAPTGEDYELAAAQDRSAAEGIEGFAIPAGLRWEDGPYGHQGEGVMAWESAGRRGVLEIATGGGKTISSLIAAHRLAEDRPLLIVVSAPTRLLVEQWADEMQQFGLHPYRSTGGGTSRDHIRAVEGLANLIRTGASRIESVVVTINTLLDPGFVRAVDSVGSNVLFIGDEMHNLGTDRFTSAPPKVAYRLGLSATPERQYDPEGTARLLEYFGPVAFRFSLKDAIRTGALVPYRYRLDVAHLEADETEKYLGLTERIRKMFAHADADEENPALQRLLEKRRLILESARQKLPILREQLIAAGPKTLTHTLVYCTDKNPDQLLAVNAMLQELGIRFHQLTADETSHPKIVERILGRFRDGDLQVITAKRVLDEGFNIPEIAEAFILASTTVERQWVQRRGRILRTCPAIGKVQAILHDIIVLPPPEAGSDDDLAAMVDREIRRCREFDRLSNNRFAKDGQAPLIAEIERQYLMWRPGDCQ